MTDLEYIERINEFRKQENIAIIAHNYQSPEIQDLADYTGDSLELSKISAKIDANLIFFCGVTFMAETAKIISPEKRVFLPRMDAVCPMAEMVGSDDILRFKEKNPGFKVVSYVNSTADTKAVSDCCCTSSNAIRICRNIEGNDIFFVPDKNLGDYCRRNVPEKNFVLWQGYCCVHENITKSELLFAKKKHPSAEVLVHPECRPEVVELADKALSTSQMLFHTKNSDRDEFIIGTEEGVVHRMKKDSPGKKFYPIERDRICASMKRITLKDLHDSILMKKHEVFLDKSVMDRARRAIEKMFEIGG